MYTDAKILYGHSMSQSLPYDEIKFDRTVKMEDMLNTPDDRDIIYFAAAELKNPDEINEKKLSIFSCE